MSEIAEILDSIQNSDVFFHFESDFVDWTDDSSVDFAIQSKGQKSIISLCEPKHIESLAASLYFYTKNSNLLTWNLKNILSFFRKKSQINVNFSNKVYDLSVLCSYFSLPKKKPTTSKEAFFLFNHIRKTDSWKSFEKFYDKVYYPLISNVIPSIETNPLVDLAEKKFVYSYYEIEGQSNGRMKNLKVLKDCYLPHSMGEKQKNILRLPSDDSVFMYYDFKHMEVSVLEWITKDANLSKILDSNVDLYRSIWQSLTKSEATKEQRKICKNIFLPVIFGQGSNSLSKRLGINEKFAEKLIYKLEQTFPVAFDWVKSQTVDSNNYATDIFGRRRKFQKEELYKIRNFCIQSPSNMICLRKLVKLHESINNKAKIFFHIHDGYAIACKRKDLKLVFELGKKALEEDDDLFPNLKLKTSCHFGEHLNNLKNIKEVIK
jgi:hypothetical protein